MSTLPSTAPALIEPSLTPNLTLVLVTVGLVAVGTSLVLDRSLVRVLLGVVLMGNGVAVLYLVVSGRAGRPPFVGEAPESISDPLPQAMVLTAIVISLATIGFLLALSYRLWQISGTDDVPDDAEDARIQRLAHEDATSATYDPSEASTTTSDELATDDVARDEMTAHRPDARERDPSELPPDGLGSERRLSDELESQGSGQAGGHAVGSDGSGTTGDPGGSTTRGGDDRG